MKMLVFARRNAREILRDPLTAIFSLGFPVVILALLTAIQANVPVTCEEMTVEEAKNEGAIGIFTSKYGERVRVYTVPGVSKEICSGPHVHNTGELHHFKIQKEQASSAGIRRIRATLD